MAPRGAGAGGAPGLTAGPHRGDLPGGAVGSVPAWRRLCLPLSSGPCGEGGMCPLGTPPTPVSRGCTPEGHRAFPAAAHVAFGSWGLSAPSFGRRERLWRGSVLAQGKVLVKCLYWVIPACCRKSSCLFRLSRLSRSPSGSALRLQR